MIATPVLWVRCIRIPTLPERASWRGCLSLRQLIQAKRATARPKDLDTIAELEPILEELEGGVES